MKNARVTVCLIVLMTLCLAAPALADEPITASACMPMTGFKDETNMKKELLREAKLDAISQIFGTHIVSQMLVKDSELTKSSIEAFMEGKVKTKGTPRYYNGKNFGDACVTINAYADKAEIMRYLPRAIEGSACINSGDVNTIKARAVTKAKVDALRLVDASLMKYSDEQVAELLKNSKIVKAGFNEDNNYCVKIAGTYYPVEIQKLTSRNVVTTGEGIGRIALKKKILFVNDKPAKALHTKRGVAAFCTELVKGTKRTAAICKQNLYVMDSSGKRMKAYAFAKNDRHYSIRTWNISDLKWLKDGRLLVFVGAKSGSPVYFKNWKTTDTGSIPPFRYYMVTFDEMNNIKRIAGSNSLPKM